MTLIELKALLGIAPEDTTQDALLQLYLEAAMEEVVAYTNLFDWSADPLVLPASITLGIKRYVEIMRDLNGRRVGVQAQSIGGMSQTFGTNVSQSELYADVWTVLGKYHRPSIFRPAKYAHQGGR